MESVANRRLPGVYFQVVQPPPETVLPRMDIAGFVGFAAQGPVNRPVAIEDPGRFRDVFGGDLPLAWDPREGNYQAAFLAPAVEAFFRNGGRRCWVVRVADAAHTNTFRLSGLVDADSGRPALIDARCPGSWSDDLRVGTVLNRRVLSIPPGTGPDRLFLNDDGSYDLAVESRSDQVRPGDLLRLTYDTGEELYLTVAARNVMRSGKLHITGIQGRWFRTHLDDLASIPEGTITRSATAVLLFGSGEADDAVLPPCVVRIPTGHASTGFEVLFDTAPATVPGVGDVLHLDIPDNPPDQRELWLSVREAYVGSVPDSLPSDDDSFPTEAVRVDAVAGLWPFRMTLPEQGTLVEALQETPFTIERLTMRLLTWGGRELQAGMDDLGLSGWLDADDDSRRFAERASGGEIATRFWGRLPDDDTLFSLKDGLPVDTPPIGSLEREAFSPRFPLAGPVAAPLLTIPLGMSSRPDASMALGRLPDEIVAALERDGLTTYGAGLFLDEDLRDERLTTFASLAEDKLYFRGEALSGVHSLLPIEEVTIVAVPDAVHGGWVFEEAETVSVLEAPSWAPDTPEWLDGATPCSPGIFRLCWSAGGGSDSTYELEESTRPDFAVKILRHRGEEACAKVLFDAGCTDVLYYRVRVERENRFSPWSATLRLYVPEPDFVGDVPVDAPSLGIELDFSLLEGELRWTSVSRADRYTLQAAVDPAFVTAVDVKRSDAASLFYQLDPLPGGVTYYRVRAERSGENTAEVGPWSETVTFQPLPKSDWVARSAASFHDEGSRAPGELLALHRALLRFCAARGDMLAVLSLPSHYREDQAFAHVAALTPDTRDDDRFPLPSTQIVHTIPAFSLDEGRALSYGALYHPWTAVRSEGPQNVGVRFSPPDGAVAGIIAARAISRGAWIAPANVPLTDVVALEPEIELSSREAWLNANINLIMRDPRGFSPMSADTLSASAELRPVNVRRLLILLRRLALREGNNLVFQSNSADLRRRVRLQFLGLLSGLFERGAFLGETPEQAFRVETGSAVNTVESIDRGRLIVELRVAPSRPLSFITVRLIQRDGSGFNIEEI